MRIDAHQHFWNLATGDYPWMAGDTMRPVRRDFGPTDLEPLIRAAGIDKTIIVQCRHDLAETLDFLAIAAAHDFVAGVVGWVDLQAADVREQIRTLRAAPGGDKLVGIRHIAHDEADPDWLAREDVQRGVATVFDEGLAYDILSRTRELPAAVRLVDSLPDGRFVLDHMAKPPLADGDLSKWLPLFEEIAARRNVWCKVSGLVTEADWAGWTADQIADCAQMALEFFGPKRIIFGSDWPVCTLAATYAEVAGIAASLADAHPEIAEGLFHLNAVEAYRLTL